MAGSAHFHAVNNLDEIVALMIRDKHREVAKKVEVEAKKNAPAVKRWKSLADGGVRKQHVHAHGLEVPTNIRFTLPAYQWDVDNPGRVGPLSRGTRGGGPQDREAQMAPGQKTYLLYPRDTTGGAYVAVVNCRCYLETDPDGIRRLVRTGPTTVTGRKVRTVVYAEGNYVVEAEVGEVYPKGVPKALGTKFMKKAVQQVARQTKARAAVK